MSEEPQGGTQRGKRVGRGLRLVALGLLSALAGVFILVHIPPVRAALLRYALNIARQRYGIIVEASRLDYNLVTLRIGLVQVRVSADHSPEQPFFEADAVGVDLPTRALFGDLTFDEIRVNSGRARVVRRADGSTNLPRPTETPKGEPEPLRVARLSVEHLSLELRDDARQMVLAVPGVDSTLSPAEGRLALLEPARLEVGPRRTGISQLEGGITFDGRVVELENVRLRSDEGAIRLDGRLSLLTQEPSLELIVDGQADVGRLARWGMSGDDDVPQGELTLQGVVAGPIADPRVDLRLQAPLLTWRGVSATGVGANARVGTWGIQLSRLELGLGGGRAEAVGALPFDGTQVAGVMASWNGVDAAGLLRTLRPDIGLLPAGSVSGRIDAEGPPAELAKWSGDLRVNVAAGPTRPGRLAIPGDTHIRLSESGWKLEGRHSVGGVAPLSAELSGRLDITDLGRSTIGGVVRVETAELPSLLKVLRAAGLIQLETEPVTSGRLEASAQLEGRFASPRAEVQVIAEELAGSGYQVGNAAVNLSGTPLDRQLRFVLNLDRTSVAEQPLGVIRAQGQLTGDELQVESLSVAHPSDTGAVVASGTFDIPSQRFDATAHVNDWQIVPTEERPLRGTASGMFRGAGTIGEPRGSGNLTLPDLSWGEVAIGNLGADVELDGKTALVKVAVSEFSATGTAQIGLSAPYAATIDAQADRTDIARLVRDLDLQSRVALTGTLTATVHAEGDIESWRTGKANLELSALDAKAGELTVRASEPWRASVASQRVQVERLEADVGDTHVGVSGKLPISSGVGSAEIDDGLFLTATGDLDGVARAAAAVGIAEVPQARGDGPIALQARVTGTLQEPFVDADAEVGPATLTVGDFPQVTGLSFRAHLENETIELREAEAAYQGANLSAVGRAPLALFNLPVRGAGGTNASLQARVTGITPAVLESLVDAATLEQLEGSVDASLDLTSNSLQLEDLTGELRLDRLEGRIAELPVGQMSPTRIVARNGFARIESWDWVGQGATLTVRGQVRLSDRQAAILANGTVDARMLTPFVRDAGLTMAGRVEPRLSITGAIDDPRIDGDVVLGDGQLRLLNPRIVAVDLTTRAVLTRTAVHIPSLTGTVNGGALTGNGLVEFGSGTATNGQMSAEIRGMALEFPEGLRSELDASLTGTVTTGSEPDSTQARVGGTVTVVRAAYREPIAVLTGLLTTLQDQQLAASAEGPSLLDRVSLDVRVVTDEDVIVDNNIARLQLGGDLRLIGTAAAPALSGRAELREGGQLFVGRNTYTVNLGAITFDNPVAIDPNLNVEATTRAGGEDIVVRLTGTAQTLQTELTSPSDPQLGQAEITSLLLTGQRIEDLAPDDAAFIGAQVLGNFSGEVLGFAGRAVGLDTIRLGGVTDASLRADPAAVATETDPTSRLTFGKSIFSNVELTLSQSLRESSAQTWILDYLPSRRLLLRLVSDDDDLRSYGFRHDVTFGVTTPAVRPAQESRRMEMRVTSVMFTGELAVPEAELRRLVDLEPGDRFDFESWQRDRDRLEQFFRESGRLTARIEANRTETDEGVALSYEVNAGPLTSIRISGADLGGDVQERLETAWAESVFDGFLIEEATAIVGSALAADGFYRAKVSARVEQQGDSRTLLVEIEPGLQSNEVEIGIEGIDGSIRQEVEEWIAAQDLDVRAATDPDALERELTTYLRGSGYLNASVAVGAPRFEGNTVTVPVTVDAGISSTLATVSFEGTRGLPSQQLLEVSGLEVGATFKPTAVSSAVDLLTRHYRSEGFAAARVRFRQEAQSETGAVDVTFIIDEGPRSILSEIVVTGNRAIDTDVVENALRLSLQEPLRTEEVLRARTGVFNTGLFRRVDVSTDPIETADDETVPTRVRVVVEEWPALRLRYGFQMREERPEDSLTGRDLEPGLSGDLTRRTLFGRALTIGVAAEYQRRERMGRVFFSTPTTFGLPVGSSLVMERSRLSFAADSLVTDQTSVSWEQRTRLWDNVTVSYAYRFARDHTFDTEPSPDPIFPAFDVALNVARLTGATAWDSRDDPANTMRGMLLSSSFEFAPEALGSDIRFVRYLAQGYVFRLVGNTVFVSAARFGAVLGLGGQEVIPSERFYAGGARTVRGVPEDSLGEIDFLGNPMGGRGLLVLNQEVRVPLYRWFGGAGFVDAGNVFPTVRSIDLSELVGSVGVGLRISTPVGVVRADVARRMWGSAETPQSWRWVIGLGQAF